MRLPRSALQLSRVAALTAIVVACKAKSATGPDGASKAASITVVQGNAQTAQAGRALPGAIVLRVVDDKGKGVAKQAATLVVTTGGGTVTPATVVSDSLGEMKLTWTLGQASAVQTVSAILDGTPGALIAASAVFPSSVIVAQGQAQSGKIATALKNDVVVRVVGASNQPMVGIPVTFTVTEGGGAITPQSGVTNALGEMAGKWTLGAVVGSNSVVVTAGSLPVAVVRATGTP